MVSLFDKNFRIKWVELIHFLPFVVVLVYTCINYYFIAPALKEQLIVSHKVYALIVQKFYVLFTIQIIGYNIAVILKYRNYSMNLKNQYSIIDENGNNWLKISLFGFFIASLASQVCGYFSLNGILIHIDWFLLSHLLFLLFFIVLFYIAITSPHLVQIDKKQKYWYSALDASEALKILTTLEKYMEKSKSYLDSSLSLKLLAQSVGISERSLSQVINEFRKQNFFDYINTYRVKYAKELLKNPSFKQRTMLDILFESGFNSKSSFNTTFKKHTGRTPSEYRRQNVSAN